MAETCVHEILFRGKRTDNGEWVYGSLIHQDDYCCILDSPNEANSMDYPYLDGDLGTIDGCATPVDLDTVGQFTGLCDKNGNHIFEGDMVEYRKRRDLIVVWNDGALWLMHEDTLFALLDHYTSEFVIVIGNRWDNPELLEKECRNDGQGSM